MDQAIGPAFTKWSRKTLVALLTEAHDGFVTSSNPVGGSVVVVGVHRPAEFGDLLAVSLREARRRGGVVEMVTVWKPGDVPDAATLWAAGREARRRALATQRRAIASTADEASDLEITGVIAEGELCEVLEEASQGAACLVLGPSGPDGRTRRPDFLQRVGCPVIRLQPATDVPPQRRGHERNSPRHHLHHAASAGTEPMATSAAG